MSNFVTVEKTWYYYLIDTCAKYNNLIETILEEKFTNYDPLPILGKETYDIGLKEDCVISST